MNKRLILLIIAVSCLSLLFVVNQIVKPKAPQISIAACKDCNVIILSVDTLRADHLGLYGYQLDTSPNIDRFFKDGLIFSNVVTTSPKTTPSFATLFTGLEPRFSGVREVPQEIPANLSLMQSEFKKNNFVTAAVVSNFVLKKNISKLDRDFDYYDDNFSKPELNRAEILERLAEDATQATISWLENRPKDRKFFLWAHYMDPHGAYTPPLEYKNKFANSKPTSRWIEEEKIPSYIRLKDITRDGTKVAVDDLIRAYDGEIAYADFEIAKLLEYLKNSGLLDKTIIIFHGDHGENLSEHEQFGHESDLLRSTTRIPVVIKFPDSMSMPAYDFKNLISIADLFPTILDLVGIKDYPKSNGVSLLPLLKSGEHPRKEIFMERYKNKKYEVTGLVNKDIKLIRYGNADTAKLVCYDLNSDPGELNPNYCDSKREREMIEKLNIILRQDTSKAIFERPREPKEIKALESLGYIN